MLKLIAVICEVQGTLNAFALKHRWALMAWLTLVMVAAFALPALGVNPVFVVPASLTFILLPWFRLQRGVVTFLVAPCFKRSAVCEVHMLGVAGPMSLRNALRQELPDLIQALHAQGVPSVDLRSILLASPAHRMLVIAYLTRALAARGLTLDVQDQGARPSAGDAFAFWLMHVMPVLCSGSAPDAWLNRLRTSQGATLCGTVHVCGCPEAE